MSVIEHPPAGAGAVPGRRGASARRWARAWSAAPFALRAVVLSRVLVLAAGALAAIWGARHEGWDAFDPAAVSAHLGAVGNVAGATAVRWDAVHYLAIAGSGYRSPASTVFFPLYPMLVRALAPLCGSTTAAGVFISLLAFAIGLWLVHRLARLELDARVADATVALLAFAPLAFFFTAIYTESLFLALSAGCFYAMRTRRWGLAAVLLALSAATRITGLVLVAPLLVSWWQAGRRPRWVAIGSPAAGLAGLAAFLGFCAAAGFGLLAPFQQQTGATHQHTMAGPAVTLWLGVRDAVQGLGQLVSGHATVVSPSVAGALSLPAQNLMLLGILALALATAVIALRVLPRAYGVYAVCCLLVDLWSPVAGRPLVSLDRYCLTVFPLWIAAASQIGERRRLMPVLAVSGGWLAFDAFQFAHWAFIA